MKQTLLFFFALVVATTGEENFVDEIAPTLRMSKEDIQTCVNMTNISSEDLKHFNQIMAYDLQTKDSDYSVRKTSCFYACSEKTEVTKHGHINMQRLTRILHFQKENNIHGFERDLAKIFYKCGQQANTKIDPCEVNFQYLSCVTKERRLQNI